MAAVLQCSGLVTAGVAASTTRYIPCGNGDLSLATTEAPAQRTVRSAGTSSNLYVRVVTNDRAASTVRLRVNGVDGNQSVSLSGTGEFEDATNTDTLAAGDEVNYSLVTGSGGTAFSLGVVSTVFAATTNTVQRLNIAVAGGVSLAAASTTRYIKLTGQLGDQATAEATEQFLFNTGATLKNLFCYISANARTNSTTIGTRKNASNGAQSVSIGAGATGIFEDTANSDSISDGDLANYYLTTGTGAESITYTLISVECETTNSKTVYASSGRYNQALNVTAYHAIGGGNAANQTTESATQSQANVAATLSNLNCYVGENTITDTSTGRLRVNTANGNQSVSIGASATGEFEDTASSDAVAAGDLIDYQLVTANSGTTMRLHRWSVVASISEATPTTTTLPLSLMANIRHVHQVNSY